jgi:hypothetical protein
MDECQTVNDCGSYVSIKRVKYKQEEKSSPIARRRHHQSTFHIPPTLSLPDIPSKHQLANSQQSTAPDQGTCKS